MSDPVSNSEIEDVLASIRRLVSENAKALKGDRARAPEAEKLVLTPALRINESEAPPPRTDVFAVDTETWNDVSGKAEDTENKGVFSHKEHRPSVVIDAGSDPDEATEDAAENAPVSMFADAAQTARSDALQTDEGVETGMESDEASAREVPAAKTESDMQTVADAESLRDETLAANDLEQRIAELETAMDLHPVGPEPGPDAVTDAGSDNIGQGEEEIAPAVSAPSEAARTVGDTEAPAADTAAADGAQETRAVPRADEAEAVAPAATADAVERAAAEASDAPPRSWIEGLVAAAAAAESTRLAERAKARGDADDSSATDVATAAEQTDQAEETLTAADIDDEAEAAVSNQGTADVEEDAPGREVFELTEAHAAPPEPEAVAPEVAGTDAAETTVEGPTFDADAAEALPETGLPKADDRPDESYETAQETAEVDATDAPAAAEDDAAAPVFGSDDYSADDLADEISAEAPPADVVRAEVDGVDEVEGEAEAGPERSWVDRLIAAAATLRTAPKPAEADEATDGGLESDGVEEEAAVEAETELPADEADAEGIVAEEAVAEETSADEADAEETVTEETVTGETVTEKTVAEETMAEEPEDEGDAEAETVSEGVTPFALEPLNLVDPIGAGAKAEADVPEWEPADPPRQIDGEADEPIVDIDTVLTGPWTAASSVEETATDALAEALDPVSDEQALEAAEERADGEVPAATEAATKATIADDSSAGADEVSVGALEWEPVDAPERPETDADTLPETAEADAERSDVDGAADDLEEATPGADNAAGDVDFHDERESGDVDDADAATPDVGVTDDAHEADEIDGDSAAVAAAAEAEADWEDAGMASAGLAMVGSGLDAHDPADDTAAPESDPDAVSDADIEPRAAAAHEDEAVIDEAMLRELVAQLVRDELQGAVGERITHNVRRLIRREIARALTLQDFEK